MDFKKESGFKTPITTATFKIKAFPKRVEFYPKLDLFLLYEIGTIVLNVSNCACMTILPIGTK